MLKDKRIVVTGGSGFIGSHIVDVLIDIGANVIVLDEKPNQAPPRKNLTYICGDIKCLKTCIDACKDVDMICHQAAYISVPDSFKCILEYDKNNISGTLNLLQAAKILNIKRFVYASSSAVYGDCKILPFSEETVGNQQSPYGLTKLVNEMYASLYHKQWQMETVGLRYFNVYGERQNPNGAYAAVIPKFITLMSEGKQPMIFGDGSATRDFVYIKDIVRANLIALTTTNTECFGKAFNIASDDIVSIYDLFCLIKKELQVELKPIYKPERLGDIPHTSADTYKAKTILGYQAKTKLSDGLLNTINFFVKN